MNSNNCRFVSIKYLLIQVGSSVTRKVFPPDDHVGGGGFLVHDPVLGHVAAQLPLHGREVHSLVSSAIVTRMIKMHPYLFTPNLST